MRAGTAQGAVALADSLQMRVGCAIGEVETTCVAQMAINKAHYAERAGIARRSKEAERQSKEAVEQLPQTPMARRVTGEQEDKGWRDAHVQRCTQLRVLLNFICFTIHIRQVSQCSRGCEGKGGSAWHRDQVWD